MKEEILDFRWFLSVVLVVLSLQGQEWSPLNDDKSDTQNLNFIPPVNHEIVKHKLCNINEDINLFLTKQIGEKKYVTNENTNRFIKE